MAGLALALWEQAFCVAMCVSLIHIYRERCNWQGRLPRFLTENSYAVYVFHAPVVVGIAVLLTHMPAPILLRFLVLSSSAVLVTYGVASVLRRLPLLNSILWHPCPWQNDLVSIIAIHVNHKENA